MPYRTGTPYDLNNARLRFIVKRNRKTMLKEKIYPITLYCTLIGGFALALANQMMM